MIYSLTEYMRERKDNNDFALESEIKQVPCYQELVSYLSQSLDFTERLREINPGSPTGKAVMMLQSHGSLRSDGGHRESMSGVSGIGSIMKEKERRAMEQTQVIKSKWKYISSSLKHIPEKVIIQ